jgi:hypothetical protein
MFGMIGVFAESERSMIQERALDLLELRPATKKSAPKSMRPSKPTSESAANGRGCQNSKDDVSNLSDAMDVGPVPGRSCDTHQISREGVLPDHIVFCASAGQLRQRSVRQNKRSEPDRTKLGAFARVTR